MKYLITLIMYIITFNQAKVLASNVVTAKNIERKSQKTIIKTKKSLVAKSVIKKIDVAIKNKDFLGARVLIKKLSKSKLTYSEWLSVRNILNKYPSVGFDILFKWGQLLPSTTSSRVMDINEKIDDQVAQADELMLKGQFKEAFVVYQKLAKQLKNEILKNKKENYFLYQTLIHYMARALYGSGNFKDSLRVYSWISKDYFRYKQVLFEKMWAAFRAERLDVALGTIASQHSSYFSEVIEPESYLIQIYIFKKLCRDDDVKKVLENIDEQKIKMLEKNNISFFEEWTKSDIEYISLQNLVNSKEVVSYEGNPIAKIERSKEIALIKKSLEDKFVTEKKRLLTQLETVKAFSLLSSAIGKVKVNLDVVPNREKLMASGKEFWPVDDAEDWLDELGEHLYIGESQCEDKVSN